MATLPKTGVKFVNDGLVLEVQESECTCAGCFFLQGENCACSFSLNCEDIDNENFIIYKYVREATDDEIRKGVVDV